MSLVSNLLSSVRGERLSYAPDWYQGAAGARTYAGTYVDEESGMRAATALTCIRKNAQVIASMPFNFYRRTDNEGKELAKSHPLFSVIHNSPNSRMTSFEWVERIVQDLDSYGNHFALPVMDTKGNVVELWPLLPRRIEVDWFDRTIEQSPRIYTYWLRDGRRSVYFEDDIFHIPGPGFDGLKGYSPIQMMMQTVGHELALEQFGARFFSNGAAPRLVLKHPAQLGDEAYARLKERFKKAYAGLANAHDVAVLEEGMTVEKLSISPDEAQFLETKKFTRGVIGGFYDMPPHLIGDTEKSTSWGTGIEQQNIGWVITGLLPRAKRIETRIGLSLLGVRERNSFFAEINLAGLLRGDSKSRADYYQRMINLGIMSPNDVRRLENLNPLPGGDVYQRPLNVMFVDADGNAVGGVPLPKKKKIAQKALPPPEILEPRLLAAPGGDE